MAAAQFLEQKVVPNQILLLPSGEPQKALLFATKGLLKDTSAGKKEICPENKHVGTLSCGDMGAALCTQTAFCNSHSKCSCSKHGSLLRMLNNSIDCRFQVFKSLVVCQHQNFFMM